MAEDEISKFIGCILSIKTKPNKEGIGTNIIGTLRLIDQASGFITLDDVVRNGEMLPDGFKLSTNDIGDLFICGLAPQLINENQNFTIAAPNNSNPKKLDKSSKENIPYHKNQLSSQPTNQFKAPPKSSNNDLKQKNDNVGPALSPNKQNANPTNENISSAGSALMSMFVKPTKQTSGESEKQESKLDDPKVVYKASDVEQTYFNNARKAHNKSFQLQQILQPDQSSKLGVHTQLNSPQNKDQRQSSDLAFEGSKNSTNGSSPKKGLGLGFHSFANASSNQNPKASERSRTRQIQGPINSKQPQRDARTFEMTNDEIQANEFDFEMNLNLFEKLPVNTKRPTKVQHNPHFTSADTTFKVSRTIESIKLRGIPSEKTFITTTGVLIPAVNQSTRKSILDLANNLGITHSRTVESMGRSIAQVCIPLLGDSFRFSPERPDDRPKIAVCVGSHWQGAAGLCAARVLASQGVQTYVYHNTLSTDENELYKVEEQLYKLCSQPLTKSLSNYDTIDYDLIILGLGELLRDEVQLRKYKHLFKNKPLVLVDPPLLPSYHEALFDRKLDSNPTRIYIVTPNIPLPYATDSGLKVFLVNLGIPRRIYEENNVSYKSPFGDKLVVQIFPAGDTQSQQ